MRPLFRPWPERLDAIFVALAPTRRAAAVVRAVAPLRTTPASWMAGAPEGLLAAVAAHTPRVGAPTDDREWSR